jgi:flagellar basal body P-ring protein FlgI
MQSIKINESTEISQPEAYRRDCTENVQQSEVEVTKSWKKNYYFPSGVTRGELVKGLNAFGSHLNGY